MVRALHKEGLQPGNPYEDNSNKRRNPRIDLRFARAIGRRKALLEIIAYGLFILSVVAAIWQFASQPVNLPLATMPRTVSVIQADVAADS
jgi:hypothetical protein